MENMAELKTKLENLSELKTELEKWKLKSEQICKKTGNLRLSSKR